MYDEKTFKKIFKLINDLYAPKAYGKFHFPLIVEHKNTPWYETHFSFLLLPIKDKKRQIPSIQLCTAGFRKGYCELIATMAHELGHYFSSLQIEPHQKLSDRLLKRFYGRKPISHKERNKVLAEEKRAWLLGFEFLEDNGYEVCEEMLKYKKYCMGGYYRVSKQNTI